MNITCEKCNKRYAIADDKVRGKSVKIRCKQCQNVITVQGPGSEAAAMAPVTPEAQRQTVARSPVVTQPAGNAGASASPKWDEENTRAVPMMDPTPIWFAMVKGKQIGPMPIADFAAKARSNEITPRTYLWKQGMGEWKRANDVSEVSAFFVQAPPPAKDTPSKPPAPSSSASANGTHGIDPGKAVNSPANRGTAFQYISQQPASADSEDDEKTVAVSYLPGSQSTAPSSVSSEAVPQVLTKPLEHQSSHHLGDLFDDLSGPQQKPSEVGSGPLPDTTLDSEPATAPGAASGEHHDPFAALGPADPSEAPPPGEATRFFMAQAGVNKRNPPWKIALLAASLVGLPVGVLYLLSTLHVVPPVLVENEQGDMVEQEFFSTKGLSTGLRGLLSGDAQKKAEAAARKQQEQRAREREKRNQLAAAKPNSGSTGGVDALPEKRDSKGTGSQLSADEIKRMYEGTAVPGSNVNLNKLDVGPKVRFDSVPTVQSGAGLEPDAVAKVVGERMKALVGCVEDALKRNPNVKLEKVTLSLEVGTSGAVKSASLEPKRTETTDWGICLRDKAKKMAFPPADSETDVQVPLVLGASL